MICSDCGSAEIYQDLATGEQTCMHCGLVIDELNVDPSLREKIFGFEGESKLRHGEFVTPNKTEYVRGSMIHIMDIHNQNIVDGNDRAKMYRLRKEQLKAVNNGTQNRNIKLAMTTLSFTTNKLEGHGIKIPEHIEQEAGRIYRKALALELVRGRSIDGIMSASLYAACRVHGFSITLSDVSRAIELDKNEVARCYRLLITEFEKKGKKLDVKLDKIKPYLNLVISQLRLVGDVERRCLEVLEMCIDRKLSHGKRPNGMASAIVYHVAKVEMGYNVTQKEIADIAKVTEVTLRNRYHEILEKIPELAVGPDQFKPDNTVNLSVKDTD